MWKKYCQSCPAPTGPRDLIQAEVECLRSAGSPTGAFLENCSPSLSPCLPCATTFWVRDTMQFEEQEQQIEDAAGIEVDNPDDGRKPKSVPCRYCQKRFRRLEHAQFVSLFSSQFLVVEAFAGMDLRNINSSIFLKALLTIFLDGMSGHSGCSPSHLFYIQIWNLPLLTCSIPCRSDTLND